MTSATEHPVLVIRPEAIHASPHRGTQVHESFSELVAYVHRPLVRDRKDGEGGIALGNFRGGVRRLTHFAGSSLVGLDLDAGTHDAGALFAVLAPWRRLTYSTHSSALAHPKARAIVVLERMVDGGEHKALLRVLYEHLARAGVTLDPAAKDATRWWFCPIVHPDRVSEYQAHAADEDAPALPVDRLLAQAAELDARHAAAVAERGRRNPPPLPVSGDRHDGYVRGAVMRAVEHVACASAGERHAVLNGEAWSLARLGLSEDEIGRVLIPAFVGATDPAREREAERTVRDACRARGAA